VAARIKSVLDFMEITHSKEPPRKSAALDRESPGSDVDVLAPRRRKERS
jgi:hypothetical protein